MSKYYTGSEGNLKTPIAKDIFAREMLSENDKHVHVAAGDVIVEGAFSALEVLQANAIAWSKSITESTTVAVINEGVAEFFKKLGNLFMKLVESVKAFFARVWMKVSNIWKSRIEIVKKEKANIMQGASYSKDDKDEKEVKYNTKLVNVATALSKADTVSDIMASGGLDFAGVKGLAGAKAAMALVDNATLDAGSVNGLMRDGSGDATYSSDSKNDGSVSATMEAIRDIKSDMADELSSLYDESEDVKPSDVINEALGLYDKDFDKAVKSNGKAIDKLIKAADKAAKKAEKELKNSAAANDDAGKLQIAYAYCTLAQFLVTKKIAVMQSAADDAWSVISVARANFTRVKQDRNNATRENAPIGSVTENTKVTGPAGKGLARFGFSI